MLASLETPLLREDTAPAVAVMISQLLMQTGKPLYSLSVTCGWGRGTFRGRVPSQRLGTCGAVLSLPLSHSHSRRPPGRGFCLAPPGCRVTRLLDGQSSQLAGARGVVLLGDWLAE